MDRYDHHGRYILNLLRGWVRPRKERKHKPGRKLLGWREKRKAARKQASRDRRHAPPRYSRQVRHG